MNSDQATNIVTKLIVALCAGVAAKYGFQDSLPGLAATIAPAIVAAIATWLSHQGLADRTQATPSPTKTGNTSTAKLIFFAGLLGLATPVRADLLTNVPPLGVQAGLGMNLQSHQILEFVNVPVPINDTLSASVVGVRFGSTGPYQYGGGTLNVGKTWDLPVIGADRLALGSGALFNGASFTSYTCLSDDKLWQVSPNLTVGTGVGIGYMPSAKGFDLLAGVSVRWSF